MKVVYLEWLDARGIGGRISKKAAEKEGLLLWRSSRRTGFRGERNGMYDEGRTG